MTLNSDQLKQFTLDLDNTQEIMVMGPYGEYTKEQVKAEYYVIVYDADWNKGESDVFSCK